MSAVRLLTLAAALCTGIAAAAGPAPGEYITEQGWGRSRFELERIVKDSGGRLVGVARKGDLSPVWRRILADLERQAVFVFEPSGPEIDPAEAEVELPAGRTRKRP